MRSKQLPHTQSGSRVVKSFCQNFQHVLKCANQFFAQFTLACLDRQQLVRLGFELPVFRTIDEIAEQAHAEAELELHGRIALRLNDGQRQWLDALLVAELPLRRTLYNQIKRSAKKASRKHLDTVLDQLDWLESLPDSDALLEGVPATKLKHIADMASALDAGDMKDFVPAKRHMFILALIRQMRVSARDDIAKMFIRRVGTMHKSAREEFLNGDIDDIGTRVDDGCRRLGDADC